MALTLLSGCGDDDDPAARSEDARRLTELLVADPAAGPLEEVDRALRQDLPVRAADLLRDGAIPAAERMAQDMAGVEVATTEGRSLRDRLARAFERRHRALVQYEATLRRAEPDGLQAAESVRAQREVEEETAVVSERLMELLPPGGRRPSLPQRPRPSSP